VPPYGGRPVFHLGLVRNVALPHLQARSAKRGV
jgi:hypothetical protein